MSPRYTVEIEPDPDREAGFENYISSIGGIITKKSPSTHNAIEKAWAREMEIVKPLVDKILFEDDPEKIDILNSRVKSLLAQQWNYKEAASNIDYNLLRILLGYSLAHSLSDKPLVGAYVNSEGILAMSTRGVRPRHIYLFMKKHGLDGENIEPLPNICETLAISQKTADWDLFITTSTVMETLSRMTNYSNAILRNITRI